MKGACADCGAPVAGARNGALRCRPCWVIDRAEQATPLAVRFWRRVNKTEGCWLWTGARQNRGGRAGGGYGLIDGKNHAHRVSWELTHGPIPPGMCVLHKCDVKHCVNPEHLFLGSPAQNTRDMLIKRRNRNKGMAQTHCIHGHKFTHTDPVTGWRKCRTCLNEAAQRRRLRLQARATASIALGATAS